MRKIAYLSCQKSRRHSRLPPRALCGESKPVFAHRHFLDRHAADKLIAGANKHLRTIPGIRQYQIGRMSPGLRPVVDQSYQVALNLIFPSQQAEQEYQTHPQHLEFVTNFVKPLVKKVEVYDFE